MKKENKESKKNKKNKKYLGYIVGMLVAIVILSLLAIFFNCISLFQYNFMEIVTTIVVSIGIFVLTQSKDQERRKNDKLERIISLLVVDLYDVFGQPIQSENREKYLLVCKKIDTKLRVIESLSGHLNCEIEIKEIKQYRERLDEFVMDNLDIAGYFDDSNRKMKIPNWICDIETRLNNIVLKMYEN